MAKLTYEELPEWKPREPVYGRYVPVVDEFAKSGKPSARVDDDEISLTTLIGRMKNAVANSEWKDEVKVCTRKGSVWLYREEA